MTFKLKIKEARKKKGLTQSELAEKMNVAQRTISKFETQQVNPSLKRLIEIASILEISLDDLVEFNRIHDQYSQDLKKNSQK